MPDRSGLPSGVRGAGPRRSTVPSAPRGSRPDGWEGHCAISGTAVTIRMNTPVAAPGNLIRATARDYRIVQRMTDRLEAPRRRAPSSRARYRTFVQDYRSERLDRGE